METGERNLKYKDILKRISGERSLKIESRLSKA
jgi:hypothetical protein